MAKTYESQETVFISYARGDDQHMAWVKSLADCIGQESIKVLYDQDGVPPGAGKYQVMDRFIQEATVILVILTPLYKLKTVSDTGKGVGYEYPLILTQLHENGKRVVPVLRHPDFAASCPVGLSHRVYADFSTDEKFRLKLPSLLAFIKDSRYKSSGNGFTQEGAGIPLKKAGAAPWLAASAIPAALLVLFTGLHTRHDDPGPAPHGHAVPEPHLLPGSATSHSGDLHEALPPVDNSHFIHKPIGFDPDTHHHDPAGAGDGNHFHPHGHHDGHYHPEAETGHDDDDV